MHRHTIGIVLLAVSGFAGVAITSTSTQRVTPSNQQSPQGKLPLRTPAPELTYFRLITVTDTISINGLAPEATSIRITGPAGEFSGPVESDGSFAILVDLQANYVNDLLLFAKSPNRAESTPVYVEVTQDSEQPNYFIDAPQDNAEVITDSIDVFGRVSDRLAGQYGVEVTVNGIQAEVDPGIGTNGTFALNGIELPLDQPFPLEFAFTDALGNEATETIQVTRRSPSSEFIEVVSGSGATQPAYTVLPDPIVARILDTNGEPIPNKLVLFEVDQSDGLLGLTPDDVGQRKLQVRSDPITGEAHVYWRLGGDAGCSNNRVLATSTSLQGQACFVASATPGAPVQINLGSGSNQRVETNGMTRDPLRVWVSDSCNGIGDVPVTFEVVSGGGLLNGSPGPVVIPTANTGHAEVLFRAPGEPGNCVVQASIPGLTSSPTQFVVTAVQQGAQLASFEGLVLNNAQQPLEGAACRLVVDGHDQGTVLSTVGGCISWEGVEAYGDADLYVDGGTVLAAHTASGAVLGGEYPSLHFDFTLLPGVRNTIGMPVLLPELEPQNVRYYSVLEDTVLSVEGIAGLEMRIKAGSMSIDGQQAPDGTPVSLNQVHHDDIPMPMPDGVAPLFAWTLQPGGAVFDPPVEITYPNMAGLPPGAVAYFLSFDHDVGQFNIIASGTVAEDGAVIRTNPQEGITVAGWGCNCPPYAVTATCDGCFTVCTSTGSLVDGSTGGTEQDACPVVGARLSFATTGWVDTGGDKLRVCPSTPPQSIKLQPTSLISYRWELLTPQRYVTGNGSSTSIFSSHEGSYTCRFWGTPHRECAEEQLLGEHAVYVSPQDTAAEPKVTVMFRQPTVQDALELLLGPNTAGVCIPARINLPFSVVCRGDWWGIQVNEIQVETPCGLNPFFTNWFEGIAPDFVGLEAQIESLSTQVDHPDQGFPYVAFGGCGPLGAFAYRPGVQAHEDAHGTKVKPAAEERRRRILDLAQSVLVARAQYPTAEEARSALESDVTMLQSAALEEIVTKYLELARDDHLLYDFGGEAIVAQWNATSGLIESMCGIAASNSWFISQCKEELPTYACD